MYGVVSRLEKRLAIKNTSGFSRQPAETIAALANRKSRMVEMGAFSDAAKLSRIHCGMMYRCFDSRGKSYKNYGGRGITVCKEWCDSPAKFIAWAIYNGFEIGLEIDRIDNDGNYEPSNCRWVTQRVNNQNKRPAKNKASSFKGLWKVSGKSSKWRAGIRIRGRMIGLGSFENEEDGARAYDRAAFAHYGTTVGLNFPQELTAASS